MLFLALLIVVMFVPGYLLSILIGTREYRFLVALTLSYFSFIVLIALSGQLSLSLNQSALVFLGFLVLLLAGVLALSRIRSIRILGSTTSLFSETLHPWTMPGIIAATALYHLGFG